MVHNVYMLMFNDANNGKSNWASNVRDLLYNSGLNYIWDQQFNIDVSFDFIKTRINDQFIQYWLSLVQNCEKLNIYKTIKFEFCFEDYLEKCHISHFLTKLRSGTMKRNLEIGRYVNVPRNMRMCKCCNMKCVEDEYHFLLVCPAFRQVRLHWLPKYYCSWPNSRK